MRSGIRRDAVIWTALGLLVAAILIVTMRQGTPNHPIGASSHPTNPSRRSGPALNIGAHLAVGALPISGDNSDMLRRLLAATGQSVSDRSTPGSTGSTTTTTTTTTTNTTITSLNTERPSMASIDTSGVLLYPNVLSSTYPFSTRQGDVRAALDWHGSATLTLALDCHKATLSQSSALGFIGLTITASTGSCRVSVTNSGDSSRTVRYRLSIDYPDPRSNG